MQGMWTFLSFFYTILYSQAGVNSGYKTGYYKIPGSLSSNIINIMSTSNVNRTGRWVLRVDKLHPEDANGVVGKVDAEIIVVTEPLYNDPYGDTYYNNYKDILLAGVLYK